MITIDQLLESVDLDFEPRFVTKDEGGDVWIWNTRPDKRANWCLKSGTPEPFRGRFISDCLKLSEFDGKPWTECIYEVPRKTTGKIEHIKTRKSIDCSDTPEAHIEKHRTFVEIWDKINELVDYTNALIESSNIHEKQIDELQMKLEPEKCEVNELKGE